MENRRELTGLHPDLATRSSVYYGQIVYLDESKSIHQQIFCLQVSKGDGPLKGKLIVNGLQEDMASCACK